jgi:triphosphatase
MSAEYPQPKAIFCQETCSLLFYRLKHRLTCLLVDNRLANFGVENPMTIEIELKFIATPEAIAALPEKLAGFACQHFAPQKLTNIYYETADNFLRSHDIGLRIRGFDEHYEMTIKTAGKVIGGVHQRPEYNVALNQPQIDLALFPEEIWPAGCDIAQLQSELQPLFRTDFVREKWLLTYQHSEIEIAIDCGEVVAGDLREPLSEVELELKQGHTADVLALASQLATIGGLRQGALSKAARGYHLAKGAPEREIRALPVFIPAEKITVEQGLSTMLELALDYWQYHEELWVRGNSHARLPLLQAVNMVRESWVIFGSIVPRKASAALRSSLATVVSSLEQKSCSAEALCFSHDYLETKLALTSWLFSAEWRSFVDEKGQKKLAGSFKRFTDIMLGRSSAELKAVFAHPLRHLDAYQDQLPRLQRGIIALHLLSGAYSPEQYQPYVAGWQALQQAIVQQQLALIESARQQAVLQAAFWLNGQQAK